MASLSCLSCAGPIAEPAPRGPTVCPWCGHSALLGVAATRAQLEADAVQQIARDALARNPLPGTRAYALWRRILPALGALGVFGSLALVATAWTLSREWAGSAALGAGFVGCWGVGFLGSAGRRLAAVASAGVLAAPHVLRVAAGFAGMEKAGPEWWLAPVALGVVGGVVLAFGPAGAPRKR